MKCRYCKKTIWFWQSWTVDESALEEQITEYKKTLYIADYDLYAHDGCFFRQQSKDKVLFIKGPPRTWK